MILAALAAAVAIAALPAPALAADTVPVYRLLNTYTGAHLLTGSWAEYRSLEDGGWCPEGVSFRSHPGAGTPVYRLYNPSNGDHLYTTDANEYETLGRSGWRGEGTCFYGVDASDPGATPVYRLWNAAQTANGGLGSHHWTLDANEYGALPRQSGGAWRQEGAKWYGLSDDSLDRVQGWWVCESGSAQAVLHVEGGYLSAVTFRNHSVTNPGDGGPISVAPFPASPIASRQGTGYEVFLKVPMQTGPGYYLDPMNNAYLFDDDPDHLHRWFMGEHQVFERRSSAPWYWPDW